MKKLLSLKRLSIASVVLVVLLLCTFFNTSFTGYINRAGAQTLPATYSTTESGLDLKKREAKEAIDAIEIPTETTLIDWTDVLGEKDRYKNLIDAATTVAQVDNYLTEGSIKIDGMIKLEKARAAAITSSKIKPPVGYMDEKYILVSDYYKGLINAATTIAEINGYLSEVEAKYAVITDFEKVRNAALETINNKPTNPEELAAYVTLLDNTRSVYAEQVANITGEPNPGGDIAAFIQGYSNLAPQVTAIVSAFETEFARLSNVMLVHNIVVNEAAAEERIVSIVNQVMARSPISPLALAGSVKGAVTGLDYAESVADEAVGLANAHIIALNQIKANVATEAELGDVDADISACETEFKAKLGDLKQRALAAEAEAAHDKAEAARVDALIDGLSKNSSRKDVDDVRMEYERLTETQKAHVTRLKKLEEIENVKEEESPLIVWGIVLIIVTVIFLIILVLFLLVVLRKKNGRNN